MSRNPLFLMFRLPALVAAGILAACTAPAPPAGESPAPVAPPPGDAPSGPVQPGPEASPADEPAPAPRPAATDEEPALELMRLASTSAKIGVPVDLRYSFEGNVLHLAAVPRVGGSNLRVSVQHEEGLEFFEGTLNVQKADPAGVYRKQLAVTRFASGPDQIRVLVTMGVGTGSAHGFYLIPIDAGQQH